MDPLQAQLTNNLWQHQLQRPQLSAGVTKSRADVLGLSGEEAAQAQPNGGKSGDLLGSFSQALQNELQKVDQLQHNADAAVNTYATGGDITFHNVVLASTKAEMAMDLTVAVRNKLVSAYQEISRMHV